MDFTAFSIVLVSAILHASWNFAARRTSGNLSVIWIGSCMASIVCAPFAAGVLLASPLSGRALSYMLVSGGLQALYFGALSKAYEAGELSVVYPIARGSGVAGVAVASRLLLAERMSTLGIAGVLAICLGIFVLGLRRLDRRAGADEVRLALSVGLIMVAYSMVDKAAVGFISPVVYIFGVFAFSTAFLAPYVWRRHRAQCAFAWRDLKAQSAFIGVSSMATYLLILFAFRLGPLSYIAAAREFAVVIGSILGIFLLGEALTLRKGIGIAGITAGLVLIKIAR